MAVFAVDDAYQVDQVDLDDDLAVDHFLVVAQGVLVGFFGQLPGFFLSCTVFLGVFLLAADAVLTKRDVVA